MKDCTNIIAYIAMALSLASMFMSYLTISKSHTHNHLMKNMWNTFRPFKFLLLIVAISFGLLLLCLLFWHVIFQTLLK